MNNREKSGRNQGEIRGITGGNQGEYAPVLRSISMASWWVVGTNFMVVSYPGYEERLEDLPTSIKAWVEARGVMGALWRNDREMIEGVMGECVPY